ncbi:hypothetical protein CJF42_12240 [Pseudoalteromonas sp. NBT06-2]|nr:hypothetical protein CJF42_12240 [Pseudoalteromonas sp. NBT06-2]
MPCLKRFELPLIDHFINGNDIIPKLLQDTSFRTPEKTMLDLQKIQFTFFIVRDNADKIAGKYELLVSFGPIKIAKGYIFT